MTPEQAQKLDDLHAWMSEQPKAPLLAEGSGAIPTADAIVGTLQTSLRDVTQPILDRLAAIETKLGAG